MADITSSQPADRAEGLVDPADDPQTNLAPEVQEENAGTSLDQPSDDAS